MTFAEHKNVVSTLQRWFVVMGDAIISQDLRPYISTQNNDPKNGWLQL